MNSSLPRRNFLIGLGAIAAGSAFPQTSYGLDLKKSPFRISVINDEISQDFERACSVASEFGVKWIELRAMWNKNVLDLDPHEISECKRLLKKHDLRVTDIASPLFKVDWPGAPKSKFSPKQDQFNAHFGFDQQDQVIEKSIELAKSFETDRVRCFDFWRLDDIKSHRAEMNEKLRQAAEKAGKPGITLVLENEAACNTGTGKEAAEVLAAVQTSSLMLNWDPGNAATLGEWVGQFKALKKDGYHFAVSLETHWRGAGSAEESTIRSWAGMKEALQKAGAV